MNKHRTRFISLFLVLCLIADPATVFAFSSHLSSASVARVRRDLATQDRFKGEALAALSAWTRSRFNRTPTRKISQGITEKRREISSEPDDLDLILPWLHYDWSRKAKLKDALEHFG